MKVHNLKILPQYFEEALKGKKPFEVRLNDRDFKLGDIVVLEEWDGEKYTGREISGKIKYILTDEFKGITPGYVVFSYHLLGKKFG